MGERRVLCHAPADLRRPARGRRHGAARVSPPGAEESPARAFIQRVLAGGGHVQGPRRTGGAVPAGALPVDGVGPESKRDGRLKALGLAGPVTSLVALGAHPDDIEIAAGGVLLSLARAHHGLRVHYVLFTGTSARHSEARAAAAAFLPGAHVTFALHDLADGRLPGR